jgi:uracil-DNA glycosylase
MDNDRANLYSALVAARRQCRVCANLVNPADCEEGKYDSDQIGPWSLWQGNLRVDLMVVGQDWGDDRYFRNHEGRDDPNNPTNRTLRDLLRIIGYEIASPSPTDYGGGPLFFSNAVLCLKVGGMQAKLDRKCFSECGSRFLKPTVEIVSPKVLVTLGEAAYRAISGTFGIKPVPFRSAVEREEGFSLPNGTLLFPVYHCGARILNTHRTREEQEQDWRRIKLALCPD